MTSVRIEEPTFRWNTYLWEGCWGSWHSPDSCRHGMPVLPAASGDSHKRKLVHIAGPTLAQKRITVEILDEIDRQIGRFLLARLFISIVVGVAVWVGFLALGLREAGIWGLVAGVLFAVPYVGPAVVTFGAGVAGFVQFGTLSMAAAAGGLTLTIAVIEGNVLTPWLMSRANRMNPLAVFVSLLFWGWIWGVWGLLLAVPIMAAAMAVCERVDDLGSYAELLKA